MLGEYRGAGGGKQDVVMIIFHCRHERFLRKIFKNINNNPKYNSRKGK